MWERRSSCRGIFGGRQREWPRVFEGNSTWAEAIQAEMQCVLRLGNELWSDQGRSWTDTEKVRHCYIIMGSKDEHGLLPMPWEDNSFDTMDSGLQRQNFRDRDQFRGYWNDRDGEQEGPNWAATSATRGTFEHHWVRESKRPRWVTVHLKWPISLAGNTKYCHTISVVIKCPKHSSHPLGAHLCLPPL